MNSFDRGHRSARGVHALHAHRPVESKAGLRSAPVADAFVLACVLALASPSRAQDFTLPTPISITAPTRTVLAPSCAQLGPLQSATARPTLIRVESMDLRLGQQVTIMLGGAKDFAKCLLDSRTFPVLFIDHRPVEGLPARMRQDDADQTKLVVEFDLQASESNSQAWRELQRQGWPSAPAERRVAIGVGPGAPFEVVASNSMTISNKETYFHLRLGPVGPWTVWAMLACSLVALAMMCWKTNVARDRTGVRPLARDLSGRTFSLSRLALLAWTLTAMSCIAVGWLATASLPSLASGGFPLLLAASGLSAGLAASIDRARQAVATYSDNFWADLVGDTAGVSPHRLQCLIANTFLLYIVWAELIRQGTVANIDKSWALILGISSGTYILGKSAEPTRQLDPAHDPQPDPFPKG